MTNVNKDKDIEKEFFDDGLIIKNKWIKNDVLARLNNEIDNLLSKSSLNGSVSSQYYDEYTRVFDHTHLLSSLNFAELLVDLADEWKKIYPNFDKEDYVLTRVSIKSEVGAKETILWHTDQILGTFRNIVYLKGGEKDSGQFRFMKTSHRIDHDIDFAMSKEEVEHYSPLIHDCAAPEGSALFFDAKGFHCNYPRINERRIIITTWEPRNSKCKGSRVFLSSNNLTSKVVQNLKYFSFPEYKHFDDPHYDLNPDRPIPVSEALSYLIHSFRYHVIIQLKIKVKGFIDRLMGKPKKYDGAYRPS